MNYMQKKIIKTTILIMLVLASLVIITACPVPSISYDVSYSYSEGGIVEGELSQRINKNKDAMSVTAVANEGYIFVGWSDEVLTATRQDMNVQSNINVIAIFEEIENAVFYYELNYFSDIGGYISGKTSQTIRHGEDAEAVTAIANEGFRFTGWTDGISTAQRHDTDITAKINVTAEFEIITLTVNYSTDTGGYISGNASQAIAYGQDAGTVTAVADVGFQFKEWSDGVKTATRTDTIVIAEINVTAIFEIRQVRVSYNAGLGGWIDGITNQFMDYGSDAEPVIAVPDTGYRFVRWSDNLTTATRHDKNNTATAIGHIALFEKIIFAVDYNAGEGGSIFGKTSQSVEYGENAETVTATPNVGFQFKEWSDGVKTATRTDSNIIATINVTALFEIRQVRVSYNAGPGGWIDGLTNQFMDYGSDAEPVTAIADTGYVFVKWSDNLTTATRTDANVTAGISVIAEFGLGKVFNYKYNHATANNTTPSITLVYNNLAKANLVVPERRNFTFAGWYLDTDFSTIVANKNGKLLVGESVLANGSELLFAKWTGITGYTYPILMVFVTEVHATLEATNASWREENGIWREVSYTFSETEIKIAEKIAFKMSEYLNDWLYGLINFEVDIYFTTEIIGRENFYGGPNWSGFEKFYYLFAYDYAGGTGIPEVHHMLGNYRSIITTFCLNQFDQDAFTRPSGSANNKYALAYWENVVWSLWWSNIPFEALLDPASEHWPSWLRYEEVWGGFMSTYLHEFTHTVELAMHAVGDKIWNEYHNMLFYDSSVLGLTESLSLMRLYLLNNAPMGEQFVGIPYSFWVGEHNVKVDYYVTSDGQGTAYGTIVPLNQDIPMSVSFGSNLTVTAVAEDGYTFIKWSDGITTATRHDTNIISLISVTAIFEILLKE